MTLDSQITRLDLAAEEFARCVTSLSEDFFLEGIDGWTPRDIVAHLIGWNRYVIEGCTQICRGELPFYDIDPGENYSKVNAVLIHEYSSKDRSKLLGELEMSVRELKRFLESLDPEIWDRDFGLRHEGSMLTVQNTVEEVVADYTHHRKQIEEWSRRDTSLAE